VTATADTIVIGGGMVGSAIAWGLCCRGIKVLVLDGRPCFPPLLKLGGVVPSAVLLAESIG